MTNGLISFSQPFPTFFNQPFPGFGGSLSNQFLVAPFWDDINTLDGGTISYELHTSGGTLEMVSQYVSDKTNTTFEGHWMLVVFWDSVPPFSFFTSSSQVSVSIASSVVESRH